MTASLLILATACQEESDKGEGTNPGDDGSPGDIDDNHDVDDTGDAGDTGDEVLTPSCADADIVFSGPAREVRSESVDESNGIVGYTSDGSDWYLVSLVTLCNDSGAELTMDMDYGRYPYTPADVYCDLFHRAVDGGELSDEPITAWQSGADDDCKFEGATIADGAFWTVALQVRHRDAGSRYGSFDMDISVY
jgi:hypothetical protein